VSKDRRLGRGLAALLGSTDAELEGSDILPPIAAGSSATVSAPRVSESHVTEDYSAIALLQLNVYDIDDNPYQPRRDFSETEIASLAESLKTHDMLQPILVRKMGSRYQLISGERRLRAAIQAGWKTVPVRVREADDRLVAELAIVENLQRKDLNAIEKALSFKRYIDEHNCTQEELAKRLKIDRPQIANLMRLLELPQTVLDAVRTGILTAGHARAILPLGDDREQIKLAQQIIDEEWSVRQVEKYVQDRIAAEEDTTTSTLPIAPPKKKLKRSEQTAAMEQEFRRALGLKIEIQARSQQKGKIIIHYKDQAEFARIREQITGQSGVE
jgi:ParB family transcriptional regulator, chromosome partitioning protein